MSWSIRECIVGMDPVLEESQMETYLKPWKKFADFHGRATRSEYWIFVLINYLVLFALVYGSILSGGGMSEYQKYQTDPTLDLWILLYMGFTIAALIPTVAVAVRRLHDTGKSGYWYLMCFVPVIGSLGLLFFMLQDSQPEDNQYGNLM